LIAIGCLWFRSTFLPPIIGALFALAGLTYLTFLSLANALLLEVGIFSGIAEPSMVLRPSITDVIAQRRIERADASGMGHVSEWRSASRARLEPEESGSL